MEAWAVVAQAAEEAVEVAVAVLAVTCTNQITAKWPVRAIKCLRII